MILNHSKGSMGKGKVFILGVGAQKAGTTWVCFELRALGVRFPFGKEGHVWNNIEESNTDQNKIALFKDKTPQKQRRILEAIRCPKTYFEICDNILSDTEKSGDHVADFTPAYAGLSLKTYSSIKKEFEAKHFRIKVLFIVRDPIYRIWSQHRMGIKLRHRKAGKEIPTIIKDFDAEEKALIQTYNKEYMKIRTRYDETLQNLRQVFHNKEIGVFFYENLFTKASYKKLCSFLELAPANADFSRVSNPSPKSNTLLSHETQKMIINHYQETYDYMQIHYPLAKKLWEKSYSILESD